MKAHVLCWRGEVYVEFPRASWPDALRMTNRQRCLKKWSAGPILGVSGCFACHFVQAEGLAQNLAERPISNGGEWR